MVGVRLWACTQWMSTVRPSWRSCSTARTVSSNTNSRLSLTPRLVDEADINLFGAVWQIGLADSAQRHDRIDTVRQRPQSADVAQPDTIVVGMPCHNAQFVPVVTEVELVGPALSGDRGRELDEVAGARARPGVQRTTPLRGDG